MPVLAVPSASAQTAPQNQPTLQDVEVRDNLIANQESLLNTYRCQFNIDTQAVPGGCTNGQPSRGLTSPGTFNGTPTQQDVAVRDNLIANQESLLNTYRCQFNIDTQIVPGGCPTPTDQPDTPGPTQPDQPTQPEPPGQFTTISTGADHACGIRTDQTVACWGHRSYPEAVPDEQFTAIAAGTSWTCGIKTDKTIECWGYGYTRTGEAGEAIRQWEALRQSRGLGPFPYPVVPNGHFLAISAGAEHACGIRTDQTVTCWGEYVDSRAVADVPAGKFTAISSTHEQNCGIRTDKTVTCWGEHYEGATITSSRFNTISTGIDHGCGIRTDDTAVCWGWYSLPSQVDERPISLAANHDKTCAVRRDNTAVCVTYDYRRTHAFTAPKGQFTVISPGLNLVCGIRTDKTVACWGTPLFAGETNPPSRHFTAIAAGGKHGCAIRIDNTAVCWGSNTFGQSSAPHGHFTAIAAGSAHTCAIKTDQTAVCWGANHTGKKLVGQSIAPDGQFIAIAAGSAHTCAIKTDQTAVCWGDNNSGQASAPSGRFNSISATGHISCGIKTDSTAICWGDGGAFGGGPGYAPAGRFNAITVGGNYGAWHACAITTEGDVVCWGNNDHGRAEAPEGRFTSIAAGAEHSCGIRADKTLECWGSNHSGQANAPSGTFTAISAGPGLSCGIRTDNTAVCWNHATSAPDGVEWVLLVPDDLGEILAAEAEMARLVNELRQGLGLAPLTYNPGLANVARGWSQTMRDTGRFVHNPNYIQQYPGGATLGRENIATVSGSTLLEAVQIAFDGLVASPGHYATMTSTDVNHFGIGIAIEGSSFWFTQNFAYYP